MALQFSDKKSIREFQERLLQWYKEKGRILPWRQTTNPYHIMVSEFMLQQTQVDRVISKYQAFLKSFPTIIALANAEQKEVLKHWTGLGYNRRALFLHQAAKQISELKEFPETPDDLQQIKGIGPYAAAAITAFAFNKDVTVIDTNIKRILFRYFISQNVQVSAKIIEQLGTDALPSKKSRDWYNALMDLGATICTAKSPKCDACPVKHNCKAKTLMDKGKTTQPLYDLTIPKQSKFLGSRRMFRGKILKALQHKEELTVPYLATILLKDESFVEDILKQLEKEGFVKRTKDKVQLA